MRVYFVKDGGETYAYVASDMISAIRLWREFERLGDNHDPDSIECPFDGGHVFVEGVDTPTFREEDVQ